jgi:hypothetical protein
MRDEPITLNMVGALRVIVYCYLSPSEADCYTHPLLSSLLFATLFSSHKSRSVPPVTPFCSFPFFHFLSSPLLSSHSFNFPFHSPLTSPFHTSPLHTSPLLTFLPLPRLTLPFLRSFPFPFPSSPLLSSPFLCLPAGSVAVCLYKSVAILFD